MNVDVFAERVLRRPLWAHQAEAALSQAFITVIAAARRTGKTSLIETLAIWTAFSNAGCRVVILSATQDAARRITEGINDTLAENPDLRGAVVDDYSTKIRLANGSQIISLPASQKQVRGYGEGVLLLILDEAGFQPNEMWTAAQYVALDEKANGSRIVLAGTPWGSSEAFFRKAFVAGEDGDPDHASFHWTFRANPRLDHDYLERQRDRVSPIEFAAEVEGRWSDAAGALFSTELIEDQTIPIDMPSLADLIGGSARPSVGVDTGVSFDRSAVAAVYRLNGVKKSERRRRGAAAVRPLPLHVARGCPVLRGGRGRPSTARADVESGDQRARRRVRPNSSTRSSAACRGTAQVEPGRDVGEVEDDRLHDDARPRRTRPALLAARRRLPAPAPRAEDRTARAGFRRRSKTTRASSSTTIWSTPGCCRWGPPRG